MTVKVPPSISGRGASSKVAFLLQHMTARVTNPVFPLGPMVQGTKSLFHIAVEASNHFSALEPVNS